MPTAGEFIPTFGGAVHSAAEQFANKAGSAPQVQQPVYWETLYGLLVATEWSVGERLLQQMGVPNQASDFVARFVRNQLLADVVPRRTPGATAQDVAGHRNLLDQRENEYRQRMTANNAPFGYLLAGHILAAAGLNPNDPNSLGAAARDVDQAVGTLRLPEAAVYLSQP